MKGKGLTQITYHRRRLISYHHLKKTQTKLIHSLFKSISVNVDQT
ncbi:unknown protein [Simkania negevensis Z]|uniref:Uncharacterized protein n=1 Tax=Simkania negevensis (strain ATCC VR-1471 / DSM 27360 / Z) TaxID=331113 RepID=F8L5B9_SIMNZ|nr:unknown protein [Simkania negevensis Z]